MAAIDPVELTRTLLGFDTRNPEKTEKACAEHLGGLLEEHGFTVETHEFAKNRPNLVARLGGAAKKRSRKAPICFTGHTDTVPLGATDWSVDPFKGEIKDGKLYGRGSSDMKAGVAAFVAAAIEERKAAEGGPGVVLVITAGEETGCEGARYLAEKKALGKAGAVVVAEPTSNRAMAGHKGALWLKATAAGVTAHGSMPEKGESAAYKAARMVTKLEHFGFAVPAHEAMGVPTLNVGTLKSGLNVNSVPDRAEIGIDIRTVAGMSHDQVRSRLEAYLAPDLDALEPIIDLEGVWTDPADPWVKTVAAAAREVTGEDQAPGAMTYFTDAAYLTPAYGTVPTVVLGPGEPAMAHQTDEYCVVDRIGEAATIYRALIRDWAG